VRILPLAFPAGVRKGTDASLQPLLPVRKTTTTREPPRNMDSHVSSTAEPMSFVDEQGIGHAELLNALRAMRNGDFPVRLPSDRTGIAGKIGDMFNDLAIANEQLASELVRVADSVGRRGKT